MWIMAGLVLLVIGGVANALDAQPKRPMVLWTAVEVATFVRGLGPAYESYAVKLLAAGIDGRALRAISDPILEQSGVSTVSASSPPSPHNPNHHLILSPSLHTIPVFPKSHDFHLTDHIHVRRDPTADRDQRTIRDRMER